MKSKVIVILAIIVLLLSCLFAGCGVSQEEYDRVSAHFGASQIRIAELQKEYDEVNAELRASQAQVAELQKEYDGVNAELRTSQAQITELETEIETKIKKLREQYEIVGETPAETAESIVKHYHETHIYSKYDFFVCSDMALDVWNMLKTQGIDALIQIGNVDTGAEDITEADHAWVLAEASPGRYLALETTGGYVVYKEDNELYYKGWAFDNPKEYKKYVELKQEYNIRVSMINQLITIAQVTNEEYEREYDYYQELRNKFNTEYVGHPVSLEAFEFRGKIEAQIATAKELEGRYNQLNELIEDQQQELENAVSEMKGVIQ